MQALQAQLSVTLAPLADRYPRQVHSLGDGGTGFTSSAGQNNLPIPRTMLARFPVDVDLVAHQIGFPCVVKRLVGSYGEGVVLIRDAGSFRDLMELIASLDRSQAVILQQDIGSRAGQDLRVWVIGGRVLGAMLRSSKDGSFKANITRGGEGHPYPLKPEIEQLALSRAAAQAALCREINLEPSGSNSTALKWFDWQPT